MPIHPGAIVIAGAALLAACARDPQLTAYAVPETPLVVQMPQPVATTTQTSVLGGTTVTGRTYAVTFDAVQYAVVHLPIPEPVREAIRQQPHEGMMDAAQAELVRAAQGTVQQQVGAGLPTPTASFQGREVTLRLPGGRQVMVARLFVTDADYFQVVVIRPAEPSYDQQLYSTRFLESARLR